MTIKEQMQQWLFERGMSERQAEEVMRRVVADEARAAMQGRWNDAVEGYPPQLCAVLCAVVSRHALEWIDEKCSLAWYRPLFEGKASEGAGESASPH